MKRTVRSALFRVHTWVGLAAGLYLALMSASGSALAFYPELYRALKPRPAIASGPIRLNQSQLKEAAQKFHPGYEVTWIWERNEPAGLVEIWMKDESRQSERLFNAFTGEDLGTASPFSIRALNWLKDLHRNLLSGTTGQIVNALGAFLLTVLALSGLFIMWPRITRWRINSVGPKLDRRTHRSIGFWALPFVLMSGGTGWFSRSNR